MADFAASLLTLPVADFTARATAYLDDARGRAAALKADANPDAAALLAGFDQCFGAIGDAAAIVSLTRSVHPDPTVRAAAEEIEVQASALESELSLDRGLYDRLMAVSDTARAALDEASQYLLDKSRRDFRRAGVDRDDATRARVLALRDELTKIGQEFERNIRDDRKSIRVTTAELAGLPADWIAARPADAEGLHTVTTDTPDYVPFVTYAESEPRRRELWTLYRQRALANRDVLQKLLAARHELATLLDFPSWAAYATADKMIGSDAAAGDFIAQVADGTKARAAVDYQRLLAEKRSVAPDAERVNPWDAGYLHERVTKRECDFDAQAIRPYFSLPRVVDGVLATTARLFGIAYRKVEDAPLWDPEVLVYDVTEGTTTLGRVYLDLYPRDGKYKHFAQFTVRSGVRDRALPEGALVCNFPRPTAAAPALLEHAQVRTLFHEFGHLLHHILGGRTCYALQSGVATEWDFVEAPSQLLEEWVWDHNTLATFAHHVETGEVLPKALLEKAERADRYGKGLWAAQQMFYAAVSLELHRRGPGFDIHALCDDLQARLTPYAPQPSTYFEASFGHLNGYSALYYTYMWSLVLAKDIYHVFSVDKAGPETAARRYRATILEPGGSQPADVLLRRFLGRAAAPEAFFAWLNAA